MYMELLNVIYPPTNKTVKEEALHRTQTWFAGKLGYTTTDFVEVMLDNIRIIWEELERDNGY